MQRTTIYDAYRDADSECRAQVRDEYVLAVVFFCNQTLTSCINKAYPDSASPSTPSDLIGSFLASTDNTSEANHTPAGISDEVLKKKVLALMLGQPCIYMYIPSIRPSISFGDWERMVGFSLLLADFERHYMPCRF